VQMGYLVCGGELRAVVPQFSKSRTGAPVIFQEVVHSIGTGPPAHPELKCNHRRQYIRLNDKMPYPRVGVADERIR